MNREQEFSFPLSTGCISDMKYMGTNTIAFFITVIRHRMRKLDRLIESKINAISMVEMFDLLQMQIILRNCMRKTRATFDSAQCKPIISFMRTKDWFVIGENVVCMASQDDSEDMLTAVECCIADIRIIDGETTILVTEGNGYNLLQSDNSYFGMYLIDSPCIRKQWEHKFLLEHLEFAKSWWKMSKSQEYRIEIAELLF